MIFNSTPRNILLALALSPWLLTSAHPLTDIVHIPDIFIKSHCPFPVYIKEVIAGTDDNPHHPYGLGIPDLILAPNHTFTSNYYWNHTGIAIKLAREPWIPGTPEPLITQLEYTYEADTRALWYDLSEIDCYNQIGADTQARHCPFFQHGVVMRAAPVCEIIACGPGNMKCADAYVTPWDGYETKCVTGRAPRLTVDLCPADFEGFVETLQVQRKAAVAEVAKAVEMEVQMATKALKEMAEEEKA